MGRSHGRAAERRVAAVGHRGVDVPARRIQIDQRRMSVREIRHEVAVGRRADRDRTRVARRPRDAVVAPSSISITVAGGDHGGDISSFQVGDDRGQISGARGAVDVQAAAEAHVHRRDVVRLPKAVHVLEACEQVARDPSDALREAGGTPLSFLREDLY